MEQKNANYEGNMGKFTIAAEEAVRRKLVRTVGRTWTENSIVWCGLSGSGLEFETTAEQVEIVLTGDNTTAGNATEGKARMAILADGVRVADTMMEQPEQSYVVPAAKEGQTQPVRIQVIKISECAMSVAGVKSITLISGRGQEKSLTEKCEASLTDGDMQTAVGNRMAAVLERALQIEFIGDSITCGYGVDLEDPEKGFSTETEDVTKAYAYKTARLLNADYSMVSFSGYGIISGYTDTDQKVENQLVPHYYEALGFSYGKPVNGTAPQDIPWEFANYRPQVIVINLGTNDDSYCKDIPERREEFTEAYVQFLQTVRSHNPQAQILCVLGLMEVKLYPQVELAVERYRARTGDMRVTSMELPVQRAEDGLVCDYHPTERSHQKAADLVAGKIKELLGK